MLGKTGQVGHELLRVLSPLHEVTAPDRVQLDLTNADSIRRVIADARPEVIINAAGFTLVDAAEGEAELAMQLNGVAPGIIAECAKKTGATFVHYSTVFVYDGTKQSPYLETDAPNPLNAYGRSKLAGDNAVIACGGNHIILRVNWVYSVRRTNFMLTILKLARERASLKVTADQDGSPTSAACYAAATARLVEKGGALRELTGIYNLAAEGHCNRLEWARALIDCASEYSGLREGWAQLLSTTTADYPLTAKRPLNTVTDCSKIKRAMGIEMPPWRTQLEELLRGMYPASA